MTNRQTAFLAAAITPGGDCLAAEVDQRAIRWTRWLVAADAQLFPPRDYGFPPPSPQVDICKARKHRRAEVVLSTYDPAESRAWGKQ